jgi:outer membrane protein OmpA-like peptidoglycan-associated protein
MRLFVVDPNAGPIQNIVIKMTAPDGSVYYTKETDAQGYAEVLVPIGQRYEMEYLSLGRRNTTANVEVPSGPNQDLRLTLRYRRYRGVEGEGETPRFVLDGVHFDSNSATIRPESHRRLDRVVEYMTHKPNARIRVAGYTDNVGNPRTNRTLSERRAQAVRAYLVSHGLDGGRIEAVGYGDESPIASNDTEEGRQQNRRIEAVEL